MIRLALLVLLVQSGVSDYDEDWYTTGEGILDQQPFSSQKQLHDNLTNYLRSIVFMDTEKIQTLTSQMAMKELNRVTTFQLKPSKDSFKTNVFPMPEGEKYCVAGVKTRIGCNTCHCIAGQMYLCTSMFCPPDEKTPISKIHSSTLLRCKEGKRRKLDDGCNFCICRGGQEFCTAKTCLFKEPKRLSHTSACKNGSKRWLNDTCNYCICWEGKEVCTLMDCPASEWEKQLLDQKAQCVEGERLPTPDDCNSCYCVNEKILCTMHECDHASDLKDLRKRNAPPCLEGQVYGSTCESCTCVNQQLRCINNCTQDMNRNHSRRQLNECGGDFSEMSSEDCNVCMCLNGKKYCTEIDCENNDGDIAASNSSAMGYQLRKKKPERHPDDIWHTLGFGNNRIIPLLNECGEDFKEMPSDDCNVCMCFKGQVFCSKKICKISHPSKSSKEKFCSEGSFYSPDDNRFCRSCFCLPNGVSVCFLNMCKYSTDTPLLYKIRAPPGLQCVPRETVKPTECTTCKCMADGKWSCLRAPGCLKPECNAGDEFQIGSKSFCAGCKCQDDQWFCGVTMKPCPGTEKCPPGTFVRSKSRPCSSCLCKLKQPNMCFTDLACSRKAIKDVLSDARI